MRRVSRTHRRLWPALALLLAAVSGARATPSLPPDLRAVWASNQTPSPFTAQELVRDTIDVHAQRAIQEMSAAGDPELQGFAVLMARAAVRGVVQGIFLENTRVPILRAKGLGMPWWEIVPEGRGAVCWKQPAEDPPVVVFDEKIKDDRGALGLALREAFVECGLGYLVVDAVDASGGYRVDCRIEIEPHANGYPGKRSAAGTTLVEALHPGTYRANVACGDGEKRVETAVTRGGVAKVRIDPAGPDAAKRLGTRTAGGSRRVLHRGP